MGRHRLPKDELNSHCALCNLYIWIKEPIHGIYDGCKNVRIDAKITDEPESVWVMKDETTFQAICNKCFTEGKHGQNRKS